VAEVEGATAWEKFWKITFPSVAPMMLVNVIYTMVDLLLGDKSTMYSLIQSHISSVEYSYAATASLVCFVVWSVMILLVYTIINRRVHYTFE
jgi:ABC-type sugar transport system permease subunit